MNDIKKQSNLLESEKERIRLKKTRLKFKKEIDKLLRKYTIYYSLMIAFQSILIIIWLWLQWNLSVPILIIGLVFPIWGLAQTRERCKNLYRAVKRLKEVDDTIVENIRKIEIEKARYE